MKYYAIDTTYGRSETIVEPADTLEQAQRLIENLGGWIDGQRFIAVPMVQKIEMPYVCLCGIGNDADPTQHAEACPYFLPF